MSTKPIVAFFGATGGCALNALALALKNGYQCVAFARTPGKLAKMLTEAPHAILQATIAAQLEIVTGDIHSVEAIKPVFAKNPAIIISGIGGAPKLSMNPMRPIALDQPNICTDAGTNIVDALKQLNAEGNLSTKPFFVAVGSAGMSTTRDVPLLMVPVYKMFLPEMHADKHVMEAVIINACKETNPVLAGFTIVRPSHLTDGEPQGFQALRTGWERHPLSVTGPAGPGPAVGYTVRRADVGLWMYENLIHGSASEWNWRCVSITY